MSRLDSIRDDLDVLRRRLVKGEISKEDYRELQAEIAAGLSPDELSELGIGAAPPPFAPSGIVTQVPDLSELELAPNTVLLNQWRIERTLGRGGFGVVFEATDLLLGRTLAVKVLDPSMAARKDLLTRFRREVSVMRELAHRRVVRVFDYREDPEENLALITMEVVQGCSVRELAALARERTQPVPVAVALEIFKQTLEALAAAHSKGVIHRDVSPGNILLAGGSADDLLSDSERDPQVKLVDFGIAVLLDRQETSAEQRAIGTGAYAAPEVLDPGADVTTRADVYGASAVAYELLCGRTPLVTGHEAIGQLRPDVGPEITELLTQMLQAEPTRRPDAEPALAQLISAMVHRSGQNSGSQPPPPPIASPQKQQLLREQVKQTIPAQRRPQLAQAADELHSLLESADGDDEILRRGEEEPAAPAAKPRPRSGGKGGLRLLVALLAALVVAGVTIWGLIAISAHLFGQFSTPLPPPQPTPVTIIVTSDGSRERPLCSWTEACVWDTATKQLCASKLCEASGYAEGEFVSASNNMCEESATDQMLWYFLADQDRFDQGVWGSDAYLTARCRGWVADRPEPKLPAPTATPLSDIITSDGSRERPLCSWTEVCTWDRATKELCASMLCEASGYAGGEFVSASNNMCEDNATDETVWYFLTDRSTYETGAWMADAFITARCLGPSHRDDFAAGGGKK